MMTITRKLLFARGWDLLLTAELSDDEIVEGFFDHIDSKDAELRTLRERAEKAERERDEMRRQRDGWMDLTATAESALESRDDDVSALRARVAELECQGYVRGRRAGLREGVELAKEHAIAEAGCSEGCCGASIEWCDVDEEMKRRLGE